MGLNQKPHNKHFFLKAEMTLQLDCLETFSEKVHLNLNMNDMKSVTKALSQPDKFQHVILQLWRH